MLEVIVCLKQIVDLQQIRIKRDTRQPVLEGAPLVFGDMDKNALEEAVRIKEKHQARVTALSVGSARLRDTIKEALAMGADEAVILTDPLFQGSDTMGSARTLAAAIGKLGQYDLILLGEGSADEYSGQVGPRLAELLGLPQITYVRQLEVLDGGVRAVRSLEEAFEVVEADFPVLVTVTGEINEPRLPTLMQILKAGKKPLHEWTMADIGLTGDQVGGEASTIEVLSNLAPVQERKNILFEGGVEEVVEELVKALTREGVLQ